jgi:hypothetical protein
VNEVFELGRQRLEPTGRASQDGAGARVFERTTRVLEPSCQRRGVLDGIGGSASHCTLSSAMRSWAFAPDSVSISCDDRQSIRLLSRQCPRTLVLGRALLLPLGDRFAHGVAGRLELLNERFVDDGIRLQFGPGESKGRAARTGLLGFVFVTNASARRSKYDGALRDPRRPSARAPPGPVALPPRFVGLWYGHGGPPPCCEPVVQLPQATPRRRSARVRQLHCPCARTSIRR